MQAKYQRFLENHQRRIQEEEEKDEFGRHWYEVGRATLKDVFNYEKMDERQRERHARVEIACLGEYGPPREDCKRQLPTVCPESNDFV